jgi:hypothetical protein
VIEALATLRLAASLHDDPLSAAEFAELALHAGSLYRQSAAWDRVARGARRTLPPAAR